MLTKLAVAQIALQTQDGNSQVLSPQKQNSFIDVSPTDQKHTLRIKLKQPPVKIKVQKQQQYSQRPQTSGQYQN